jgi:membrane associated rhomboid family serine protease
MTPWVLRLLVANVAVYFITSSGTVDLRYLALIPGAILIQPWGVFTYMFVHGGFMHLFMNMIGLFFFGPRLETQLGGKSFLGLYLISGLGGALFSFLFARHGYVVGASGAVFGILLGFAYFWPRDKIYIWGILPVEARYLVGVLAAMALYSGFSGTGAGTAHFAHLGGFVAGYGFLRWRRRKYFQQWQPMDTPKSHLAKAAQRSGDGASLRRWESIRFEAMHELNREEAKRLVAKAKVSGVGTLTLDERAMLDRFSTPQ